MNINSTHFMPRRLGLIITFGLAALAMIYLSYSLPRLLPGDFITAMYASSPVTLSAEQETELRAFYTEDSGFCNYLLKLVNLDWGYSYAFLTPVSVLFLEALPWTLLLFGTAHIISISIGFIAGVEASWRQGGKMEKGLVGGMTFLEGIPEISTGVILLVIFALNLRWFPAAGAETTYANVSFTAWVADVGRHLGLPKRRIRYAHAARNALLPLVTRFGLRLAFMITGVLVVEKIYSYPGLGTLLFNAIQVRDLPVIQAVVLISSLMVLTIILVLEFVYRIIDPRIEYAR